LAPSIPTIEPTIIISGDTIKWTRDFSDFPASTYDLTYYVKGASSQTVATTKSGDTFLVTIDASVTDQWTEGSYWWEAKATVGTERYTAATGKFLVTKNFATDDSVYDGRSHAKKVLDAIEAVIEDRASVDQLAITIAGRTLQRTPPADLLLIKTHYSAEYQNELEKDKLERGESTGRKILIRFSGG